MDYIKAFIIGGIICALTQILLDRTKLMPGRIMVLLVCSGAVLGVFLGGFKASAVGISAALIFGYLASLIFSPKMKR